MSIKFKYSYRLIVYFLILLASIALVFTVYMFKQNRSYSVAALQGELKNYNSFIYSEIQKGNKIPSIPSDRRINYTILDTLGYVIYDSKEEIESFLDNQISQTEIVAAQQNGEGSALRASLSDEQEEYLFYAKKFPDYYIKTYITFSTLKPTQVETDNRYFFLIALLLLALFASVFFIGKKLIRPLKSYTQLTDAIKNNEDLEKLSFDNDDFGEVGKEIANTFVQLDEAKKFKQKMTQDIAHELKTPITAIKGYLETILNDSQMDEEQKIKFIKNSYSQTIRLSELINEVSTLNKLDEANSSDSQKEFYKIEKVYFASCIEDILGEVGGRLADKNISFHSQISNTLSIRGVYNLLYSLFKNLIDNTIEHSGGNCSIMLKGWEEDEKIFFEYSDSGVGVPAEALNKLFNRFYRVDKGRVRKSGEVSGSGLGLAIVKNSITYHKGEIEAFSPSTGGVIFKFFIQSL